MIPFRSFTGDGVDAIVAVHSALSDHAPELVDHFNRAVLEIRLAPQFCPAGSAACVREDLPRVVLFAMEPEYMTLAELGRVLLHEARHLQQPCCGTWTIFPHTCSDAFCTRPTERKEDPVYREDVAVLPRIIEALSAAGRNPHAPWKARPASILELLAGVALVGGVTVVGAAVANRLTKRWEPRAQRYRDASGGHWRGSGVFD